jgi:hypothetical protein
MYMILLTRGAIFGGEQAGGFSGIYLLIKPE